MPHGQLQTGLSLGAEDVAQPKMRNGGGGETYLCESGLGVKMD